MRVTKDFFETEYLGGPQVVEAIHKVNELIRTMEGLDRVMAKRFRAWLTMCYKRDGHGKTKSVGGICAEWLSSPQEAISYLRTLTEHGGGQLRRISATKPFGPDNMEFRENEPHRTFSA